MPKHLLLEGTDLETLLSQVRAEHGPEASIVSADRVRSGGFAGFFARQRYELTVSVPDEAPAAPAPAKSAPQNEAMPQDESAQDEAATQDPVAALLARTEERERRLTAPAPKQETPAEAPAFTATPAATTTMDQAFADVLAAQRRPEHPTSPTPAGVQAFQPRTVEPDRPLAAPLRALGMPDHLVRRATGTDTYRAVVRALAAMPEAPAAPDRPGDVLVIVGPARTALPIAEATARALSLGPAQILLAARSTAGTGVHHTRRISGPAEAVRRARKLHRADVAHVVVVDACAEDGNGEWARAVTDALGATAVWALVDASRKIADTARFLGALGPVHGLAVTALDATGDPASVLGLGFPVARLDDRPSSPHTWAALLCDRLEGQA
ncbi:hypothetical protein [Actinomadura hibisca]|uniref:hypothetical protein n=1 Tax=Actinomadura hibisca TaxID=68565 RepID=UPI00082FFAA5|nr:hypothetical protein [Actinomadura hibisca]